MAAFRTISLNCCCAIFDYTMDRIFHPESLSAQVFSPHSMAVLAATLLGFFLSYVGIPAAMSFIMAGTFLAGLAQYIINQNRSQLGASMPSYVAAPE